MSYNPPTPEQFSDLHSRMLNVPPIPMDAGWSVLPIPPFARAMARMVVFNGDGASVSIYLDEGNRLGLSPEGVEPYWEIYPDETGDIDRFLMHDTAGLVSAIRAAFASGLSLDDDQ